MRIRSFIIVVVPILIGCARAGTWQPPVGHAANPESSVAPYHAPPNMLAGGGDRLAPPISDDSVEHDHGAHSGHADHSDHADSESYPLDTCIVSGAPLGSMGEPVVYSHDGIEVRFCCAGCIETFEEDPQEYLPPLLDARGEPAPHHSSTPGGEE